MTFFLPLLLCALFIGNPFLTQLHAIGDDEIEAQGDPVLAAIGHCRSKLKTDPQLRQVKLALARLLESQLSDENVAEVLELYESCADKATSSSDSSAILPPSGFQ